MRQYSDIPAALTFERNTLRVTDIHMKKRFSYIDLDQCNIKYPGVLIKPKADGF